MNYKNNCLYEKTRDLVKQHPQAIAPIAPIAPYCEICGEMRSKRVHQKCSKIKQRMYARVVL